MVMTFLPHADLKCPLLPLPHQSHQSHSGSVELSFWSWADTM
uniref:Uncharacterized protein n=1 Tax=Anguilla anguilla TaxID=7936 RepID=A0A0E9SVN3_ANGAN